MKKMLLLLLAGAMLLTSCTSGEDNSGNSDTQGNNSAQMDTDDNTLGDDDGDGMIEDGADGGNNSPGGMMEPSDGTGNSDTSGNNSGASGSENGNSDNSGTVGGNGGNGGTAGGNNGGNGGTAGGNSSGGTSSGGNLNAGGDNSAFDAVEKVESADDAVNFIGANVYSLCPDVIPMMTETRTLSKEDMDSITYNTGLTDTSGIEDVILSESMIGSVTYSFIMLRTDGTNTEELQKALGDSVNPRKWVCVQAERIASVTLDDDIILVMGAAEQVDTIMNAVTTAADSVYKTVGSVVAVMG